MNEEKTPWLTDKRWKDGVARSGAAAELFPWWFAAVVCLVLMAPVLMKGPDLVRDAGLMAVCAMGLVALGGVAALYQAIKHTLAWSRYGRLELRLDPFPGSLGGHVGGAVDVPLDRLESGAVRVTLSCIRVRITRGKNRSRWESVVWSREQAPVVELARHGTRLRFTFEIPADLPETEPRSDHYHYWATRIVAAVPGFDLDRAFEIPVHRLPQPRRASSPAPPPAAIVHDPSRELVAAESGVEVTQTADGLRLHYPVGRSVQAGVMAVVFGLIFVGTAAGFGYAGASVFPRDGAFGVGGWLFLGPFLLVFGVVGTLIALLGIWLLVNSLEVHVRTGELVTTRRILGLPSTKHVPLSDVERIELSINGQIGQGAKAEVSYHMRAFLRSGKRLVLGDGIRGAPAAERLARVMEGATRVPTTIVARRDKNRWPGRRSARARAA